MAAAVPDVAVLMELPGQIPSAMPSAVLGAP